MAAGTARSTGAQPGTARAQHGARLDGPHHAAARIPPTEYLMWQTLVGAWPIDAERLTGYLRKAMREAKLTTSWTEPDSRYEAAAIGFAAASTDRRRALRQDRRRSWPRSARTHTRTRSAPSSCS